MALPQFRGVVAGRAPLLMQVSSPSGGPLVRVVRASAVGENSLGVASRPALSRPSTPGTGPTTSVESNNPLSAAPHASLITTFTTAPSLPTAVTGAFALPMRMVWAAAPGEEFFVLPGGAALFYAAASEGHLWSGGIVWEES